MYPAPPNKRLKLPGWLSKEAFGCAPTNSYRRPGRLRPPALAPQLKRDPLGRGLLTDGHPMLDEQNAPT